MVCSVSTLFSTLSCAAARQHSIAASVAVLPWHLPAAPAADPPPTCLPAAACALLLVQLRKPLDLWSFIKSPYGMMIGFMLFGIFVFPMLKVDPEEYKEAMAQLKGQAPADSGSSQQRIRDR